MQHRDQNVLDLFLFIYFYFFIIIFFKKFFLKKCSWSFHKTMDVANLISWHLISLLWLGKKAGDRSHRDRSIHIERACLPGKITRLLDKLKIFLQLMSNLQKVNKTVFTNENLRKILKIYFIYKIMRQKCCREYEFGKFLKDL